MKSLSPITAPTEEVAITEFGENVFEVLQGHPQKYVNWASLENDVRNCVSQLVEPLKDRTNHYERTVRVTNEE